MSSKVVVIPDAIHRRVAIEAARTGSTISSIVSHAIARELAVRRKQKRNSKQPAEHQQSGAVD